MPTATCFKDCFDSVRAMRFKPGDVVENLNPAADIAVYFNDESGKPLRVRPPRRAKPAPRGKVEEIGYVRAADPSPPGESFTPAELAQSDAAGQPPNPDAVGDHKPKPKK
jgi:hypothetical protein